MLHKLVIASLTLGLLATAHAQQVEWQGGEDEFWHTKENWDPEGVPGKTDKVTITNDAVTIIGGAEAQTLTVADASLDLKGNLAIGSTGIIEDFSLSGQGASITYGSLNLSGTTDWKTGNFLGPGPLTFTNTVNVPSGATRGLKDTHATSTGKFTLATRLEIENGSLRNVGDIWLTEGAQITTRGLSVAFFSNSGTLFGSGNIEIAAPGTHDGEFIMHGAQSSLKFSSPSHFSDAFVRLGVSVPNLGWASGGEVILSATRPHTFAGENKLEGYGTVVLQSAVKVDGTLSANLLGPSGLQFSSRVDGSGKIVNQGTARWTTGTLTLGGGLLNEAKFDSDGQGGFRKSGSAPVRLSTKLQNLGEMAFDGGTLTIAEGGELLNERGAKFNLAGGVLLGEGSLTSQGILSIEAIDEETTVQIGVPLTVNEGVIDAKVGEIWFQGGGNLHQTTQRIGREAHVSFRTRKPFGFSGNHNFSGNGELELVGSQMNLTQDATLQWRVDTLISENATILGETGATIDNRNRVEWQSGAIRESGDGPFVLENRGDLDIFGRSAKLGATLRNHQQTTLTGLVTMEGGTIENQTGATWLATGGAIALGAGQTPKENRFINQGTFRASGNQTLPVFLEQDGEGELRVEEGTLSLTGGGELGGKLNVAKDSRLTFASDVGRAYEVNEDLAADGEGEFRFERGQFQVREGKNVSFGKSGLTLAGNTAVVGGKGIITNRGSAIWQAGRMEFAEEGRFANVGSLLLHGNGVRRLTGTLKNLGDLQLNGALTFSNGKLINSQGSRLALGLDANPKSSPGTTNSMTNTGTLVVKNPDETSLFGPPRKRVVDIPVINDNGTIAIEQKTELILNQGAEFRGKSTVKLNNGDLSFSTSAGAQEVKITQGTTRWQGNLGTVSIDNGVTLEVQQGATLEAAEETWQHGNLHVSGTVNLVEPGYQWISGDIRVQPSGKFSVKAKGDLITLSIAGSDRKTLQGEITTERNSRTSVTSDVTLDGGQINNFGNWEVRRGRLTSTSRGGSFENHGALLALQYEEEHRAAHVVDARLNNQGSVIVGRDASLVLRGPIDQLDSKSRTLIGGAWSSSGLLQFPLPFLERIDGASVAGSTISIPALRGLTENRGKFTANDDSTLDNALRNFGELLFDRKSPPIQLTAPNGITNDEQGSVRGPAEIKGDLRSGGNVEPGSSPGRLSVDGSVTLEASSRLEIEIAGAEPATMHDVLTVTGMTELAGELDIQLIDGFLPAVGTTLDVLEYGEVAGSFETVTLTPGLEVALDLQPDRGVLTVLASPAFWPGDANGDDTVGFADFLILSNNFGKADLGFSGGDFDDDGLVGFADFLLLSNEFGTQVRRGTLPPAAVPEPATAVGLFLGLFLLTRVRSSRR